MPEEGGLLVGGLPEGIVRLQLLVPGHPEAWTSETVVRAGAMSQAARVELSPARELRLRVELEEGGPAPEDLRVNMYSSRGEVICQRQKLSGEPVWVLSPLAPGKYRMTLDSGQRHAYLEIVVSADGPTTAAVKLGRP
jgi:hypothetical protein